MNLIIANPSKDRIFRPSYYSAGKRPTTNPVINTSVTIKANIIEYEDRYVLELAVPGYEKENLEILSESGKLIVKGTAKTTAEEQQENFKLKEFRTPNFSKSYTLSDTIDGNLIEASYLQGILKIKLPKKNFIKKNIVIS